MRIFDTFRRRTLLAIFALALFSPGLRAVRAEEEPRIWHSRDGRAMEARWMSGTGDVIQVMTRDGRVGSIKRSTLSDEDQVYLSGLQNVSAAPEPGAAPATRVLILHYGDSLVAETFADFLKESGFEPDMADLRELKTPDFGSASVVLILHEATEIPSSDRAAGLIRELRRSKRPILAQGQSASHLFSRMELTLGQETLPKSLDGATLANDTDPVIRQPTPVLPFGDAPIKVYKKMNAAFAVHLRPVPDYIRAIASVPREGDDYTIAIEDSRYAIWAFTGSPEIMSPEGRQLFINLVTYLASQAPPPEKTEIKEAVTKAPEQSDAPAEPAPEPEQPIIMAPTRPAQMGMGMGPMSGAPPPPPKVSIYATGKEPPKPARGVTTYRLFLTSREARAASMFYGFEAEVHVIDAEVSVQKLGGYYTYRSESGNVQYSPRVKVLARNKDISAKTRLVIEYFSQHPDGSERKRAAVQHVELPEIAKGASVVVDAGGIFLFKQETKTNYNYNSASGAELFGLIISLFDSSGQLLFQQSTHQSLQSLASPDLPAATM